MFCRFCGAGIPADSRFCARCGRRLVTGDSGRIDTVVRRLGLKTPIPYAALLFIGFVVWAWQPARARFDYRNVTMELELQDQSSAFESNVFRHRLNLVIENGGDEPIAEIPIMLRARLEPAQPVEVVSDFLGRRIVILRNGEVLPLVVILSDRIEAGVKRRYAVDGIVTTAPPAEVTYEVVGESNGEILASIPVRIDPPAEDSRFPSTATQR